MITLNGGGTLYSGGLLDYIGTLVARIYDSIKTGSSNTIAGDGTTNAEAREAYQTCSQSR